MSKKKKSGINEARSALYGLAKLLGDIAAVNKGPEATVKRVARRVAGKATGRALGKIFK